MSAYSKKNLQNVHVMSRYSMLKKIRKFLPSPMFSEQWKICCSNWRILLKNETLVSIENQTTYRYHFVSIDFHEFQMVGIITLTRKVLSMMHKLSHAFWYLSFIVYPRNISCGSNFAANMTFVKVDWNNTITRFIILFGDKAISVQKSCFKQQDFHCSKNINLRIFFYKNVAFEFHEKLICDCDEQILELEFS